MVNLTVCFRLEPDDYYHAWLCWQRKERLIRFAMTVGIGVLVAVGLLRASGKLIAVCMAEVVLVTAVLVADLLARRKVRVSAHKNAKGRDAKTLNLTLSSSGIDDLNGNRAGWEAFSGFSESVNVFVLYRSGRIDVIMPKRALTEEEIVASREMMKLSLKSV